MLADLKKSFALLTIALVTVLGVGAVTLRDLVRDVAPVDRGLVPVARWAWPKAVEDLDAVDLAPAKSGYVVVYDRFVAAPHGRSRFEGVRLTTAACAAVEGTSPAALDARHACQVAEIPIDLREGQGPSDVRLYRAKGHPGRFVVRVADARTYAPESTVAVFDRNETPVRRFLPARILSARHVPSLVVVLAFGALAFGLRRARRAAAYARTMSGWNETRLSADGMLQDEAGATVGMLATGRRRIPEGVVLVAPDAIGGGSVYRELPIVARGLVAAGSHAQWSAASAIRLRDAKSLAVIGIVTALFGLAARFLGG